MLPQIPKEGNGNHVNFGHDMIVAVSLKDKVECVPFVFFIYKCFFLPFSCFSLMQTIKL